MAIPEPSDNVGFWDAVKHYTIDQVWPPDDENDAWDLANEWRAVAKLLSDAATGLETQAKVSEAVWMDDAGATFAYALRHLPANFRLLADNMRVLAHGMEKYGDSLRDARIGIVMELVANIVLFAVLAWLPGGGFLSQTIARFVADRLTTLIGQMIGRTLAGALPKALEMSAELGVEMGKEAIDETLINAATQLTSMAMGTRDNFDFNQLGQNALAGAIGGPIGEALGKVTAPLTRATNAGLSRVMPNGLARNLTAGISSAGNNAITSPTAGYIAQNINNLSALTDVNGYTESFKQNAISSAIVGAPRSMVVDGVQQMHAGNQQFANGLTNHVTGNTPITTPDLRGGAPAGGSGAGGSGAGGSGAGQPAGQSGGDPSGGTGKTVGGGNAGTPQTGGNTGGTQTGGGGAQTGGTPAGGTQTGAGGAQTGGGNIQTGGTPAGGTQTGGAPTGAGSGGAQTGGTQSGNSGGTQSGGTQAGAGGAQTGGTPAGGTQTGAGGAQTGGAGNTQTGGGTQTGSSQTGAGGAQTGGAGNTQAGAGGTQTGGTQTGGTPAGGAPTGAGNSGAQTGGTPAGGTQTGAGGAQTGGTQTGGGNSGAQTGAHAGGTQTSGPQTGNQAGGPQTSGESGNVQPGGEASGTHQGGTQSGDPGATQSTGQTANPAGSTTSGNGTTGNAPSAGDPGQSAPPGGTQSGTTGTTSPDPGAAQSNAGNEGVNQTVVPTGVAPGGAAPASTAGAMPAHTSSVGQAGAQTGGATGQSSPGSQSGASQAASAAGQSGNTGTQGSTQSGKASGNSGTQSTNPSQAAKPGTSQSGKPGTTGTSPGTSQSAATPVTGAQQSSGTGKTGPATTGGTPAGAALSAPSAANQAAAAASTSQAGQQSTPKAKPTHAKVGKPAAGGHPNTAPAASPHGRAVSVNKIRKDAERAEQRRHNAEKAAEEARNAAAKAKDAVRTSLAEGTAAAARKALSAAKKSGAKAVMAEKKAYVAETAASNAEKSAERAANQPGGRVSANDIQQARDAAAKAREAAEKALDAALEAFQAATPDGTPPPARGDHPAAGDPNRQPDDPTVPVQPEVHILGTYSTDRLTVVNGVITEIDGQPVAETLRELSRQRAEQYFRAKVARNPAGSMTGDRVAVVLNVRTGQVFESTSGPTGTEISPGDLVHPKLRAHEEQLRREMPSRPDEPLFRHAEVRAANEHLHVSDDVELTDLLADVWVTQANGSTLAPMHANSTGVMPGVRSLSGRQEYSAGGQQINTLAPELPASATPPAHTAAPKTATTPSAPTAPTVTNPTASAPTSTTPPSAPTASTGPATAATPPTGTPSPPSGPVQPAGPGPRSRVESVRALQHSRFTAEDKAGNRQEVAQRARDAITRVADDAGVMRIDPIPGDQRQFTVTRPDGTTFVVRVVSRPIGATQDLARIGHIGGDKFEIRVSPRASAKVIERVMASAVAQANAMVDGAPTTNLLDGTTHPGDNTTLSAEDHGLQAEVRNLDRAKRETSRLRVIRRQRIASEMRTLVEHLGMHPDDNVGAQRRAVSDVVDIVDQHVKEGDKRPAWALPPDGYPKWRAFIRYHLPAEVLPGSAAAGVIFATGAPPIVSAGVVAATTASAVTGTIIKRWYGRRQKTNVDTGHGDRIKIRIRERALQIKALHDPLLDRLNVNTPTGSVPAEPPAHVQGLPAYQKWRVRLLHRGGPSFAGASAATTLIPAGLPLWNAVALWGVTGIAASVGPLVEKYLGRSVVPQEWARLDNVGREKDQKALEFDEYFAKRLSSLIDRIENLAGIAPKGTMKIADIVKKQPVNKMGIHRFGANQADQFGNLARSAADSAGRLLAEKSAKGFISDITWNAAVNTVKTGATRSALGMVINAFLDRNFVAKEYIEIVDQVDHDFGNKMAEQVETERRALNAMLADVTAMVEEAEAANRVNTSLPGRIAYALAHPPAPPSIPKRRADADRPAGHQQRRAFFALHLKQAVAMEGVVVGAALTFNQGTAPMLVIGGVAVAVAGSFKLRFLFRRTEQRAVDATIEGDRRKERVVESAEAEARRRFDTEFFSRKIDAFANGPTTPSTPPAPAPDPNPHLDLANRSDAFVTQEREAMFTEPRPWSTLNQRLVALDRLNTLAERVRTFAQHELDTGRSRPVDQAGKDLTELREAYEKLKDDGTPMPDHFEQLKPEGMRGGESGTRPAGDLQSYLDNSVVTQAGRAYYAQGDMPDMVHVLLPAAGQYTIDMHGGPDFVRIGSDRLTADDLAALIRADPNWHGEPIRLVACETGQKADGFAQQLADRLGVRVRAPTEYVGVALDGKLYVTSLKVNEAGILVPVMPPTGRMYTFEPTVRSGDNSVPTPPLPSAVHVGMYWPDDDDVKFGELREVTPAEELGELTVTREGPTVYTGAEQLWPDELADVVADNRDWAGGPTRLQVRDGHVDPEFVQRLADLLGVPVVIPNNAVAGEFPSLSSGTLEVYNEQSAQPPIGCRVYEPRTVRA